MQLGAQSASGLRGHPCCSTREPPPWMAAWPFYISDTGAPQTTTELTKRNKGSTIWPEAPNSKEHNLIGSDQWFTDFSSLSFPFLCWQEIQNSFIWCHLCLHLISTTYHLTINTLCLPWLWQVFRAPLNALHLTWLWGLYCLPLKALWKLYLFVFLIIFLQTVNVILNDFSFLKISC